jgi:hypothetical protein
MKVHSTIYKGIEYIQVSTLPSEQREKLLLSINPDLLIKILVDGKVVTNCMQFKDYEAWFEGIYKTPAKVRNADKRKETPAPAKVPKKA